MKYPELTLTDLTSAHADTYLSSFHRALESIPELAAQWIEMGEAEQFDFRLEFTRAFGLRRLLGGLYHSNLLTPDQVTHLADLDRQLLEHAAMVEQIYGSNLRQLVRDLFAWGTPLAEQPGTLRIETTVATLAELVGVETMNN